MATKKITVTDSEGSFSLLAKAGNELYFVSKNHLDRKIVLQRTDFEKEFTIQLTPKPIELDEVKIDKNPLGKSLVTQQDLDAIKLEKQISRPVNTSVYTGEITNGLDFVRIGKGIAKLFRKKESDKEPLKPVIDFKDYVKDNFQEDFYTQTLRLKHEQIFAFIEFCEADPKSKNIAQQNNPLVVMDFLMSKSQVFKKLD